MEWPVLVLTEVVGLGKVGAVLRGGGSDNDAIISLRIFSDRSGYPITEQWKRTVKGIGCTVYIFWGGLTFDFLVLPHRACDLPCTSRMDNRHFLYRDSQTGTEFNPKPHLLKVDNDISSQSLL